MSDRGAFYKSRTRKWFLERGWQVGDLERVHWIAPKAGPRIPIKRDQFASDLLIMSQTRLVFVQVKGGTSAIGGTFAAARRGFEAFRWPSFVECWIVAWRPRDRVPRILVVYPSTQQERPHGQKGKEQEQSNRRSEEEAGTYEESGTARETVRRAQGLGSAAGAAVAAAAGYRGGSGHPRAR